MYNRSKARGTNVEYMVRDYMRSIGYEAHRVPASGAAQGFKGDIQVHRGGQTLLIEVKARATAFKFLYEFYNKYKSTSGALSFNYSGVCITVSDSFPDVCLSDRFYQDFTTEDPKLSKVLKRVLKLREYLQTCDYLVIKGNRQPLLFLRYV